MLMPAKYQPDYMFLRNVPMRRVHLFTVIQLACIVVLCVIKELGIVSIVFPVMVSSNQTTIKRFANKLTDRLQTIAQSCKRTRNIKTTQSIIITLNFHKTTYM